MNHYEEHTTIFGEEDTKEKKMRGESVVAFTPLKISKFRLYFKRYGEKEREGFRCDERRGR